MIALVIFSGFPDAGEVGLNGDTRPQMRQAGKKTHADRKIVVRTRWNFEVIFCVVLRLAACYPFAGGMLLGAPLSAQNAPAYVDPQIEAALREISAGQIQSDVERLVSFQTRSTISA